MGAEAAQRLANEANYITTQSTNEANARIAHEANEYNRENLKLQNQWNIDQWNRENDYNSPAHQMELYLEAGINPIFALGELTDSGAAHLESGVPAPAETATMQAAHFEPEYDTQLGSKLSAIVSALDTMSDGAAKFAELGLSSKDINSQIGLRNAQQGLANAQAGYVKAQTTNQDFLNKINNETYYSQVEAKRLEVENLRSQISKNESETELNKTRKGTEEELCNQIKSSTALIEEQRLSEIDKRKQAWAQININQQNADTAQFGAQSQSYYEGENLKQRNREYHFNAEKVEQELNLKSNDQIMQFYQEQRSFIDKAMGNFGFKMDSWFSSPSSPTSKVLEAFDNVKMCGTVLRWRVEKEPWNADNIKTFNEWQREVGNLPDTPIGPYRYQYQNYFSQPQSVLNPSGY